MNTSTTTETSTKLSLEEQLSENYKDWRALYQFLCELKGAAKLFELIPEMEPLSICDSQDTICHKDNIEHTFKVMQNVYDNLAGTTFNKSAMILGSLLHDIGKGPTKEFDAKNRKWTFRDHEEKGFEMAQKILPRLQIPIADHALILTLIRYHQLPSRSDSIEDRGMRKLLDKCKNYVSEVLFLSKADITSSNKEKIRQGKKRVDDLFKKMQEFSKREGLRTLKIEISCNEIADILDVHIKETNRIREGLKSRIYAGLLENKKPVIIEYLEDHYGNC